MLCSESGIAAPNNTAALHQSVVRFPDEYTLTVWLLDIKVNDIFIPLWR